MYSQASHVSRSKGFLPSPAPDELSDTDHDLISILQEKRREIEAKIEAFRAQKEREFKNFEDELRSRKRRSTNTRLEGSLSFKSGISTLCGTDLQADCPTITEKKNNIDDAKITGLKPFLGPSKPSVSIDRVTINGMTTPPASGTPPLANILSRSPINLYRTPPTSPSEKESDKSPINVDKEHNFHGLFTPSYLPLLDTKPSSLPQKSTSQSFKHSKRSLTAPSLPSLSLPSALRTKGGSVRKRKHVTFRLAHSVVVDPGSSYEETPSLSEDQDRDNLDDVEIDSAIVMLSTSLPRESFKFESDRDLASPKKDVNDAEFFSFDEELESTEDKLSNYQDVCLSNRPSRAF